MKIQILEIDLEIVKESVKAKGENKYYVYIHRKISDNKPFYIGKGCNYRCLTIYRRSKYWLRVFNKYGAFIQIYKNNLSSKEACEIEKEIIKKLKLKNLTNLSHGGENGLIGKANHMFGVRLTKEKNGNWMNRGKKNPLSKSVLKFSLEGFFIKEYASIEETKVDGFSPTAVCKCCLSKRKQHKEFVFIYKKNFDENKNYSWKRSITSKRKIESFDLNGNFLKSYDSISETKIDGFSPKAVSGVCNGSRKTHLKTIFKHTT